MKVKSFTYERNWTGKYYRQRFLPSMQTMDKHIATMLSDGWEIMTEAPHSGNSLYSSSRLVTLFIPFEGVRVAAGTAAGLGSRGPDGGGRYCRSFPSGGVRD